MCADEDGKAIALLNTRAFRTMSVPIPEKFFTWHDTTLNHFYPVLEAQGYHKVAPTELVS